MDYRDRDQIITRLELIIKLLPLGKIELQKLHRQEYDRTMRELEEHEEFMKRYEAGEYGLPKEKKKKQKYKGLFDSHKRI